MNIEQLRALLDEPPADIAFPMSLDPAAKRAADAAQMALDALTEQRDRLRAATQEERDAAGEFQSYGDLSPTVGLDEQIAEAEKLVAETREKAVEKAMRLVFRPLTSEAYEAFYLELAPAFPGGKIPIIDFDNALVRKTFLRCELPDGTDTGFDFDQATKKLTPQDRNRLRHEVANAPYEEDTSLSFDPQTSGLAATN